MRLLQAGAPPFPSPPRHQCIGHGWGSVISRPGALPSVLNSVRASQPTGDGRGSATFATGCPPRALPAPSPVCCAPLAGRSGHRNGCIAEPRTPPAVAILAQGRRGAAPADSETPSGGTSDRGGEGNAEEAPEVRDHPPSTAQAPGALGCEGGEGHLGWSRREGGRGGVTPPKRPLFPYLA